VDPNPIETTGYVGTDAKAESPENARRVGSYEQIAKEMAEKNAATRPILLWPDPMLKQVSRPVSDADWNTPAETIGKQGYQSIEKLVEIMFSTMYAARGAGLAAPQIGVNLRIFVMDVGIDGGNKPDPFVMINPEISNPEGKQQFIEGCLSVPNHTGTVERAAKVTVKYLDSSRAEHTVTLEGLAADAVQHENDHLDGIVYVERLGPMKRDIIRRSMKKLRKQMAWSEKKHAELARAVKVKGR
jgi:peptide deformylase